MTTRRSRRWVSPRGPASRCSRRRARCSGRSASWTRARATGRTRTCTCSRRSRLPRPARSRCTSPCRTSARHASAPISRAHARAPLASSLQASLLPPDLPRVPGMQVAARYLPAAGGNEVVGDFFDVFQQGPDSWGFMIGDVAGKGVEAAKLASLARHTIRTAAMQRLTPREILLTLNQAMREQEPDGDRFVSAIYGTLDVDGLGADIVLSVAGHPRPLIRRADRALETTAKPRHGARRPRRPDRVRGGDCDSLRATRWCSTRTASRRREPTAPCSARGGCASSSRAGRSMQMRSRPRSSGRSASSHRSSPTTPPC